MLRILELMGDGKRIDYQKYIDEDTLPPHIDRLHIPVPIEEIWHAKQMHQETIVTEGELHYSIVAGNDETLENLVAHARPAARGMRCVYPAGLLK